MLANAAALLDRPKTVNVGVKLFYAPMAERTQAIHVDWRPAGWGDAALSRIVAQLADDAVPDSLGAKISRANQEALSRIVAARPVLVDIKPAREVMPGMAEKTILHAGPPIEWEQMCGYAGRGYWRPYLRGLGVITGGSHWPCRQRPDSVWFLP